MTDIAGRAVGTQLPIPTTRFGTIEEATVAASSLYTFPEALPGLPDSHRYALIEDPSYDPMCWLQSLEEPLVCLPVVPLAGTSLDQYASIAARASGLQLAEVGCHRLCSQRIAGAPSRHGVGLRQRSENDDVLLGPRIRAA